MYNKIFYSAVVCAALFLLSSCGASRINHEKRLLLQGIDTAQLGNAYMPDIKIQKGDLLSILVYSDNIEATAIYNQPQTGGATMSGTTSSTNLSGSGRGYIVDPVGQIYFHSLGKMTAAGLTKSELAKKIEEGLLPVLQHPYVVVRYANPTITILGEVNKPGVINFSDQKISILDAVGFAGDFTSFSRRDNVLIVREQDGKRISERLDLRSPKIYQSPFFYLQQNDMVYIEPTRKKPTGNEQVLLRNITIVTSVLSVLTLAITLIK